MNKPRTFLTVIALFATGILLISISTLVFSLETSQVAALITAGGGILCIGAAVIVDKVRQERQNQRVNRRGNQIVSNVQTRVHQTADNTSINQELQKLITEMRNQLGTSERQASPFRITPLTHSTENKIGETAKTVQSDKTAPKKQPEVDSNRADSRAIISRHRLQEQPHLATKGRETLLGELRLNIDVPKNDFINLNSKPVEVTVDVLKATHIELTAQLKSDNLERPDTRAALVYVEAFDRNGDKIDFELLPSKSDKYGHYKYLKASGRQLANHVSIDVPRHARKIKLGFLQWACPCQLSNSVQLKIDSENENWPEVRRMKDVRVAAILDEFSYNSFKFDCDLVHLEPESWKEQIQAHQPDVFLCESAWSGRNSVTRPWQGRIYASTNFNTENRKELIEILAYCESIGIPTVFWNKEDPSHYDDKVHNFVDTALRFDHIFSTDLATVQRYRQEHGHPSVHVLPFGVQPRLFNPIVKQNTRSSDVIFAGSWYSNHVERSKDMNSMFSSVLDAGRNLKIYDRFYDSDDTKHLFPKEYAKYCVPPVSGENMAKVYKESDIGITINTETNSPTMFARRIFELAACNTYIISNYSKGVESFFGENVLYLDQKPNGLELLTEEEMQQARAANLKLVLENHTYRHRLAEILEHASVPYNGQQPACALVYVARTWTDMQTAWNSLRMIAKWRGSKTIVAGPEITPLEFADAMTEFNTAGIRLTSWQQLENGSISIKQVASHADDVLYLSDTKNVSSLIMQNIVNHSRMHLQYVDLPVIREDDILESDRREDSSLKYEIVEITDPPTSIVSVERLYGFLSDIVTESPFNAYIV